MATEIEAPYGQLIELYPLVSVSSPNSQTKCFLKWKCLVQLNSNHVLTFYFMQEEVPDHQTSSVELAIIQGVNRGPSVQGSGILLFWPSLVTCLVCMRVGVSSCTTSIWRCWQARPLSLTRDVHQNKGFQMVYISSPKSRISRSHCHFAILLHTLKGTLAICLQKLHLFVVLASCFHLKLEDCHLVEMDNLEAVPFLSKFKFRYAKLLQLLHLLSSSQPRSN